MAFKENMKEMKRTLKRFHPRYFLDRAHPLESIFLLAVGLVLIGLLIKQYTMSKMKLSKITKKINQPSYMNPTVLQQL